jgi:hypothetical protein
MMKKNTDNQLVNLLAAKEVIDFKELYNCYEIQVLNFLFYCTVNRGIPLVLIKATFTRCWAVAHDLDQKREYYPGISYGDSMKNKIVCKFDVQI